MKASFTCLFLSRSHQLPAGFCLDAHMRGRCEPVDMLRQGTCLRYGAFARAHARHRGRRWARKHARRAALPMTEALIARRLRARPFVVGANGLSPIQSARRRTFEII